MGLTYEDFPQEPTGTNDGNIMHAIERLYPFVAQQNGYYCGWLFSDKYAKMEITNLYKMFRDVNETLFWNFGVDDRHATLHKISMAKQALDEKNRSAYPIKSCIKKLIGKRMYHKLWELKERIIRG